MIPSLVSRLHALKDLHDTGLTIKATVEKMESSHDQLTVQIRAQTGQIESIERSFTDNANMIVSNMASLDARIEKLGQLIGLIR